MCWQYHEDTHLLYSYQMSFTVVSVFMKSSTVSSRDVYLLSSYLLTEITDDGKYNAVQCPRQYWEHSLTHEQDVQGPAFVMKRSHQSLTVIASLIDSGSVSSTDRVPCVRCLSWPLQAADWPTRYRNYGWPDSSTVDRVVSNGCDLVSVAHRLCRQDEWMSCLLYTSDAADE